MTIPVRAIRHLILVAIFFAGFFCGTPPGSATIRYTVSLANPEQHLFHVTLTIPDVRGEITVQMPAWNALYQIRDFSAHLGRVEAFTTVGRASMEKLDKQTWRIQVGGDAAGGSGEITVRYAAYWDEAGPFAAQLNSNHAFINPAMILLYVPERRQEQVQICLRDVPAGWRTTLQAGSGPSGSGETCGDAASYDALADAPIEAGNFEDFLLPGIQPNIRVVIHGDNWKKKRVEEELTRICRYELQLMGGAPFDSYTFILHSGKAAAGAGGYGARERHGDKCAVGRVSG